MESVFVVSCSRKPKPKLTAEVKETNIKEWIIDLKGYPYSEQCSWITCYENKLGLSERYNQILDWCTKTDMPEWIIFMHDDFILQDSALFEKLSATSSDIVGLAGTRSFDLSHPVVWHKNRGNFFDKSVISGGVCHEINNKTFMSGYGEFGPVMVVDGCFIAVRGSSVTKYNLRFDPQFTFHFYDLDFCLSAYKKGCKISTEPIFGIHKSAGDFRNDELHKRLGSIFIEKHSGKEK